MRYKEEIPSRIIKDEPNNKWDRRFNLKKRFPNSKFNLSYNQRIFISVGGVLESTIQDYNDFNLLEIKCFPNSIIIG